MAKITRKVNDKKVQKVVRAKSVKKNVRKVSKVKRNVKEKSKKELYGDMSFDDFLKQGLDVDSDSDQGAEVDDETKNGGANEQNNLDDNQEDSANDDESADEDPGNSLEDGEESNSEGPNESEQENTENSDDDSPLDEIKSHKESLAKLKETDPEFYKFLQDNDKKLLNFGESESEQEEEAESDDENKDEKVHRPNEELEVASDESDFEEGDEEKQTDTQNITLKMLKKWQNDIRTDKSNKTITCLVQAFHAALLRVSNNNEQQEPSYYKVEGSAVFNGVVQLCVLELGPAVRRFLGLKPGSKQAPHKCKKFTKIKNTMKSYFTDLLKLLGSVTSTNILTVLLKHLHYMCPLIVSFPKVNKPILKRLAHLWSTSDEAVRVVAFLCILRITANQMQPLLDSVLKMMYVLYVKNSKFVSTNTLSGINFMRRSMVEMFALDLNVSYQHVFMYIRQLAIHLRNAITVKKKENVQIVYNWQFVNSLRLWGNLFAVTCNKPQLNPLIYPFVQVCIGTINLIPTAQYYPLRFHILQILIDLTKEAQITIPVLPFLLDILHNFDFNKKHLKVSMKPLQFTSVLRLSKSQMSENGFKDALIEMIYGQIMEYLSIHANSIAFPDLSLSCVYQLKLFMKKCSNQNYVKKMRQLSEKIQQNAQFIENERKGIALNITDFKQIEGFEAQLRNKGPPLSVFYENWDKLRKIKKNKQATNNEALAEYNLPTIKKVKKKRSNNDEDKTVELFPSDSESDGEVNIDKKLDGPKEIKMKRGKRGGKNAKKKIVDNSGPVEDGGEKDVIEDLKITDW